jgi:U3 small nucleolar RNA-associated protein 21
MSRDRFIDVRMEPIVQVEVGWARESVWDNVICRHRNSPVVSTWTTRRQTKGTHLLYHKRFKTNPKYLSAVATSICLSACGNLAFIGYSTGHLDVFNMQSGKHKFSFCYSTDGKQKDEDDRTAHGSAITGLVSDLVNRTVVSGCSSGTIAFWSLNPPKLQSRVSVGNGVTHFRLDRNNSLLAVALSNGNLCIVDVLCRQIARRIPNAFMNARVTALNFSSDGKWLVGADDKSTIKIWDLATNTLIDVMRCWKPCLGLSFNETGEYLATCHEGQKAVYLWANKAIFLPEFSIRPVTEETPLSTVTQPTLSTSGNLANLAEISAEESSSSDEESDDDCQRRNVIFDDEPETDEIMEIEKRTDFNRQIASHLVTLSGQPAPRWANLSDLQAIRERNKPIEPPKKPETAPFFLPSAVTLDGFAFEKENVDESGETKREKALIAKRSLLELETPWAKSLREAESLSVADRAAVFNSLKAMNVSSIDFQIRSLPPSVFSAFLQMIIGVFNTRKDFELATSYLATFLKIHRERLFTSAEDDEAYETKRLTMAMEEALKLQEEVWTEVQQLVDESVAVAQWIKSAVL